MSKDIFQKIKEQLEENDVVLYMKGSAKIPECGFSGTVVHILKLLNVAFKDFDVLKDPDLRQGIKDFTNWPTIPQLYIKGEFIGGCDIVKEMYASGELEALLRAKKIPLSS